MKIAAVLSLMCSLGLIAATPDMSWESYHKTLLKNPQKAYELAQKAIQSKDWALREAGLKTLVATDSLRAKVAAQELVLGDPALLVRSSAVTAIKILKDKNSESVLWKALEDKRNFRKNKSLWIRPQIMATLIELRAMQKQNFKKYLNDTDPQVSRLAKSQNKN